MANSMSAGGAVAFAGAALDDAVARVGPHRVDGWTWRRDGARLELRAADPERGPGDRLLLISAGSALLTVRVLLRARGVAVTALPFPEEAQPGLLAVVRVEGARVVTAEDATLARMAMEPAIAARRVWPGSRRSCCPPCGPRRDASRRGWRSFPRRTAARSRGRRRRVPGTPAPW